MPFLLPNQQRQSTEGEDNVFTVSQNGIVTDGFTVCCTDFAG